MELLEKIKNQIIVDQASVIKHHEEILNFFKKENLGTPFIFTYSKVNGMAFVGNYTNCLNQLIEMYADKYLKSKVEEIKPL